MATINLCRKRRGLAPMQRAFIAWWLLKPTMTALGQDLLRSVSFTATNHLTAKQIDSVQTITGVSMNATQLANALIGPEVTLISASVVVGNKAQFGTFSGGDSSIGLASGIVLSTGNVIDVKGPNQSPSRTSKFNGKGYAPLQAFVQNDTDLVDAAVLEIQFACASGLSQDFVFNYSFASEEYNEYVNDNYNDVFAFFLNGEEPANNIATLSNGTAVAINSVNCGNPYNPNAGGFCSLFVNNEFNASSPAPYDIQFDGFTKPLQAKAVALASTNVMRIAITDAGDPQFDSAVFIQAGSLTCVKASATSPTVAPASISTRVPTKRPTVASNSTKRPTARRPTRRPTKPTKRPTGGCGLGSLGNLGGPTASYECLQRVRRACSCSQLCCYGRWTCPYNVISHSCPELRKARPKQQRFNEVLRDIAKRFRSWCECGSTRRFLIEADGAYEESSATTPWIPEEDLEEEPPDLWHRQHD